MHDALSHLTQHFPDDIPRVYSTPQGDDFAVVRAPAIREVARFCKDELGFAMFLSVCGVDRLLLPENKPRFEIVYQVRQAREPWKKLHLKAFVDEENPELPSVVPVWRGADWWERYTFDFYGVRFTDHPRLKRVLLYDEFQGHPLRKDYPMRGRQPLVADRDIPDIIRGPGATLPTSN